MAAGDSSINKGRVRFFIALRTRGRKRFYCRVMPSVTNAEKIASSQQVIFWEEKEGGDKWKRMGGETPPIMTIFSVAAD
jgi:hypothetical protein